MKSSLPFTSVVSYHTNEYGCGVAKFGKLLAERLGVPMRPWRGMGEGWGDFPLFSLKASELPAIDFLSFVAHVDGPYGLFWHDVGDALATDCASVVYYADPSLGSPGLWCPSLLTPSKPRTVKLFSFGMAHKLQTQHYAKVKQLLDAAGLRYHLRVSVGLHEGTSLSEATQHFDALYEILGRENVTVLGILSDDAVVEELSAADYVLAFFAGGVKRNNTTVHAALDVRAEVVTNGALLGAINLDDLAQWPSSRSQFTWERLIESMEEIYANTANRQPARL